MCPQMKKSATSNANTNAKNVSIDQERNKDNLWFIRNCIFSNMNYKSDIINNMFKIIDFNKLEQMDEYENEDEYEHKNKNKNKSTKLKIESLKNLVYINKNKKQENNDLCKRKNIFILDNVTNMVYHNDKHYGFYVMKYLEKEHKYYNSTKLIKAFHIYDKNNVYKYIFYPQIGKYKMIYSVFEEYENITKFETFKLAKKLDIQLEEIKKMLQDKNNEDKNPDNQESKNTIKYDKIKIKKTMINVINKLCYTNLDFNESMYIFMDDYLSKLKNKNIEQEKQ